MDFKCASLLLDGNMRDKVSSSRIIRLCPTQDCQDWTHVFRGLMPGDNVVLQVDSLSDFLPFMLPYCRSAVAGGGKLVYFRFARHDPLAPDSLGATVHQLDTEEGFERFIANMHRKVQEAGPGASFVFDCLSSLAEDWCSDRMLGNVLHAHLSADTPARGNRLLSDVSPMSFVPRHGGRRADDANPGRRLSAQGAALHPSTEGRGTLRGHDARAAPLGRRSVPAGDGKLDDGRDSRRSALGGAGNHTVEVGKWTRTFLHAEECWEGVRRGTLPAEEADRLVPDLLRMAVSHDERLLRLAREYLTLPDVLDIWRRMIGTGQIGGKAVGMILARAILKKSDDRWHDLLEAHDSFFVGSDVFCSFLVENDCWWLREKQHDPAHFLDRIDEARRRIMSGRFPEYLIKGLSEMLDYFGQAPIIVRSSSLLEDSYGNAFSGKYESVFCPNQGPHHQRLEDFLSAIKTVYASTMSERRCATARSGDCSTETNRCRCWCSECRASVTAACSIRRWPAWPFRATLTSGTRASTLTPA